MLTGFALVAPLLPIVPAGAVAGTCEGRPATHLGTPGDDVLTGTDGDDVMVGLGGDDTISGLLGNETRTTSRPIRRPARPSSEVRRETTSSSSMPWRT
jgi:hypothetical protein